MRLVGIPCSIFDTELSLWRRAIKPERVCKIQRDEFPQIQLLNGVTPQNIRLLADTKLLNGTKGNPIVIYR
jgi:hypothetical protein